MKIIIDKAITANGISGDELTDTSKFLPKKPLFAAQKTVKLKKLLKTWAITGNIKLPDQ